MDSHKVLEQKLLQSYSNVTQNNEIDWAVRKRHSDELVKPTIPFIGKYYDKQKIKILVYASAENLAGYYKGNKTEWIEDELDNDVIATNRHRYFLNKKEYSKDSFYPNVHLGPINNGSLSLAAYYLATKINTDFNYLPIEFYETIAFANYGKFSIETELQKNIRLGKEQVGEKANIDPIEYRATNRKYIELDIGILKPDIIIMPDSIYNDEKKFIDMCTDNIIVLGIHMLFPWVINPHIAKKYPKYQVEQLEDSVGNWYNHLSQDKMTGQNKVNYLSVFSYLDDCWQKAKEKYAVLFEKLNLK